MKKNLPTLLLLLIVLAQSGKSQAVFPGGVNKPLHWFTTETSSSPRLVDLMQNGSSIQLINPGVDNPGVNFRPTLSLSGQSTMSLTLRDSSLSSATYFTVYQSKNLSAENIVWYRLDGQKTGLVLTTSRVADLTDYQYMNYTDRKPSAPKVNVYVQHKQKDSLSVSSQKLILGSLPSSPQLPIVPFTGLVSELIIYNRVLSGQELLKVSSYLCLKYGITLSEPEGIYLNSSNEIIWEGNKYSDFHHNIAGIARDDSSGLIQPKATSGNNPEMYVVSSKENIPNKSFLLWGDNDLPLIPADKIPGVPALLQRQGIFILHGPNDNMTTDILFDTKQIDAPMPLEPVFWLVIDRSGTHDFSLPATEYIKMNSIDNKGKALFKDVVVRNPISSYAFVAGSHILLSTAITEPVCSDMRRGLLKVKIFGAVFPCQLRLTSSLGQVIYEQTITQDNTISISNIITGRYTLTVKDALNHSQSDTYYVNNADGPHSPLLQNKYVLLPGQKLELDASAGLPPDITFRWSGPANFNSTAAEVTIDKVGSYTLVATKNGCNYVKDIAVVGAPRNVFTDITVFPNPTHTGSFQVKISLDKISPVTMSIFAEDGRFIGMKEMNGFANYMSAYEINENGLYFLVFRSGVSVITKELVVIRN